MRNIKKCIILIVYLTLLVGFFGLWFKLYGGLAQKQVVQAEDNDTEIIDESVGKNGSEYVEVGMTTANEKFQIEKVENEFLLEIPSINLKKQVISNVDPVNKKEYLSVLENYVAHGKYTFLPDEAMNSGNVYLFAHREGKINGRDVGFFNRLDEVRKGDKAIVYFEGKMYVYKFRGSKIVDPSETGVYTSYSPTPTLTLQTCEDGVSKRLILTFDLISF